MNLAQTANRLALATNDEARSAVWRNNGANSVLAIAYALKEICLNDGWSNNPARCVGAAAALDWLSRTAPQPEVAALRDWCEGLAAVAHGRYADALQLLGQAERLWQELRRPHTAAETQVVALYALAMLGRYNEAVECGLQTRDIFLAHDDALAAGKIENNLGNIYFRRDLYHTAEHFQSLARQRFTALQHTVQLAKINNCLANTHAHLHRFASAEQLYAEAWAAAQAAGLTLTQAEIAGNRGNLALFQSRYDAALDWLEQSRRHYVALELPHQATLTELEIADIYLELNLLPEAIELYQRAAQTFAALGMRAEQARTLAQHGQAANAAGQPDAARVLLDQAQQLYAAEGNSVGAAAVTLNVAHGHYTQKDFTAARRAATQAAWVLRRSGNRRRWLAARWLCGETTRAAGQNDRARRILHAVLRAAETHAQPPIAYRCRVALGLAARDTGHATDAAQHFTEAAEIAETLRAILPVEEFRAAFVADKLTPYNELMRLALTAGDAAAAFAWAERARARTLTERLTRSAQTPELQPAADVFTQQAHNRLAQLRTELHWFYSLLERPAAPDAPRHAWQEAVRLRERETLEIARQLRHKNSGQWSVVSGQLGASGQPENSGQWTVVSWGQVVKWKTMVNGQWSMVNGW